MTTLDHSTAGHTEAVPVGSPADRPVTHPLDRLRPAEIAIAREVIEAAGLSGESVRFGYVGLDEPHKDVVLAHTTGSDVPRTVRVLLLDRATGAGTDVRVDVVGRAVVSLAAIDAAAGGQVPILDDEFEAIEAIVAADPGWCAAMAARGLDVSTVRAVPLSAGVFGHEDEVGRRMVRVLGFHQADGDDLPWAHPVDGVVAYVDMTEAVVTKLIDTGVLPVPQERAEYDAGRWARPARTDLKPIEITQPEGSSFRVEDDVVSWHNWRFRVGFDVREGLTLHQISYRDGEQERPVVYRASVAEMVVPYADPSPIRFWQNYFDTGEYMFARYTNSLELGCDCLGDITYLDAVVSDERGEPRTIRNAVCMHEEDYGVLWKHTDLFTGMTQTRRQRRMVISFFVTIGNYDYGFYWYLYLDGTIQLEAKATGIVFTSAFREDHPFATQIAPGLGAPFHQHLFSARLDMAVDGLTNTVSEVDAVRLPVSDTNPWGNAFGIQETPLTSESQAQRLADGSANRVWHISNPQSLNRFGNPVAYALFPEGKPVLLAADESSIAKRAAFATKHLWVTQYDAAERYPAGDLVNQHPGGDGLPAFAAADRPLEGQDVVLWHTFGLTHYPRPEDWPIMPVDYTGFVLKPVGFFDGNPALDTPPSASSCPPASSCHS